MVRPLARHGVLPHVIPFCGAKPENSRQVWCSEHKEAWACRIRWGSRWAACPKEPPLQEACMPNASCLDDVRMLPGGRSEIFYPKTVSDTPQTHSRFAYITACIGHALFPLDHRAAPMEGALVELSCGFEGPKHGGISLTRPHCHALHRTLTELRLGLRCRCGYVGEHCLPSFLHIRQIHQYGQQPVAPVV